VLYFLWRVREARTGIRPGPCADGPGERGCWVASVRRERLAPARSRADAQSCRPCTPGLLGSVSRVS
jgi:hypothetical protein